MTSLTHSDSVVVAQNPAVLYDMIADITRMGEWSPICTGGSWDDGAGPVVGAWFTGHNSTPERTWETRCQVTVAEPGHRFGYTVNSGRVFWTYDFEPLGDGTRITESWEFTDAGLDAFAERYGEQAQAEIEIRTRAAHDGIPETLAAIKRAAEALR